jgi:hypothetical protein
MCDQLPPQVSLQLLLEGAYASLVLLLLALSKFTCPPALPPVCCHSFRPTGLAAANPGLAKLLFALVFPCGLYMTIMHGVDLFTGNTMKLPAAIIEGKTDMKGLAHNWFWSYFGNFVGSLALVAMVAYSGVLAGSVLPAKMAVMKTSLTWGQVRRGRNKGGQSGG